MKNKKQNKALACRFCAADTFEIIDLGMLPLANGLVEKISDPIETFPTVLHVCSSCATAQLSHCIDKAALYSDYLYITPESSMLSKHYERISQFLVDQQGLNRKANVLEIGSNIGRFLKHLKPQVHSILGVDPASNIATMARDNGIPTMCDFFNAQSAQSIADTHGKMDLIVARHCFAHNEEPWLMLEGVAELLSPEGMFVIENAYFPDTIEKREFDQIYHEHMYYYNLRAIQQVAKKYGFKLVDCLHSTIHGGTMTYVLKYADAKGDPSDNVIKYLEDEKEMHKESFYKPFINAIEDNKKQLQTVIQQLISAGKTIHAYGASAKSTTLLNYFGINAKSIPFAVDSTPIKQGKYIPLTNIKIISEEQAQVDFPDYYLLTIWNYQQEIINKVRQSGNEKSQFIIPHPQIKII